MAWNGELITVIEAAGTWAAAGTALWLGLDVKLKERRATKVKADLCAAAVTAKLDHTLDMVQNCIAYCVFKNLEISEAESRYQSSRQVREMLTRGYFKPDIDTLLGLSSLGNKCANRIAKAFDILDVIKGQAESIPLGEFQQNGNPYGYSEMLLEQWAMMFVTVQDLLRVALRECENASAIAAPHPTGQEIHGPDVDD
jgi:hypothetical protein